MSTHLLCEYARISLADLSGTHGFSSTLTEVEMLMERRKKMRFLRFALQRNKLEEEVKEAQRKVDLACEVFNVSRKLCNSRCSEVRLIVPASCM